MKVSDLETVSGVVGVSARQWAMAALLATGRTSANRGRARSADRGSAGNERVDLFGCLAELVVLDSLSRTTGASDALDRMTKRLLDEAGGGGVIGPDLELVDGCIDVKSYEIYWRGDGLRNRMMAINAEKHAGLRSRAGLRYLVVAIELLAVRAVVARPFAGGAVDSWPLCNLVSRTEGLGATSEVRQFYRENDFRSAIGRIRELDRKAGFGSLSHNLPVGQFERRMLGGNSFRDVSGRTHSPISISQQATPALAELKQMVPAIARYVIDPDHAAQIVSAACRLDTGAAYAGTRTASATQIGRRARRG